MTSIKIVFATAAVLGMIHVVLSLLVVRQRFATQTSLGEGGKEHPSLRLAVRSHANFTENVPLALILLAGLALLGAGPKGVAVLSVALVVARLAHPVGLRLTPPNLLRGGGALLTWLVMLVASADILRHLL